MNMDNFGDCAFLGLPPPMYVSDLSSLLEALEEKKKHFEQKVKDWEENKEEMKRKILAGDLTLADLKGDDDKAADAEGDGDDYPNIKYGAETPARLKEDK